MTETNKTVRAAFIKINNYCMAHADVIDARWIAKVIDEAEQALAAEEDQNDHALHPVFHPVLDAFRELTKDLIPPPVPNRSATNAIAGEQDRRGVK